MTDHTFNRQILARTGCVLLIVLSSLTTDTPTAMAQDDGRQARMSTAMAVRKMLEGSGDATLRSFVAQHLAPAYRESMPEEEMLAKLRTLREATRGAGDLDLERIPQGLAMIFSGEKVSTVRVHLQEGPPWKIVELGLERTDASADDPRQARRLRMKAVEGLGARGGDDVLQSFVDEHLTAAYVASIPEAELSDLLRRVRRLSATAGSIRVTETDDGLRIGFRGAQNGDVYVGLESTAPYRISSLRIDTDVAREEESVEAVEPITWDTLEARLEEAEKNGFSGAVLVVRGGKTVLHRGYGKADRERGRAVTPETIFGIGSTPIDFTRGAVLLLEQKGKLSTSDTITRFFPDAPADKRGMTIDHLMTGRSGLPNFHHDPRTDADYDLTWIARATAVRRILGQELLFAPGADEAHSHSAWVLLAAVVEKVSGTSYGDFLRRGFFEPAGMTRTGFYGPHPTLGDEDFAVGYGSSSAGEVNIPLYWGETSWLAMGSGGMFSTVGDMYRWIRAVHGGSLLKGKALAKYRKKGVLSGGSDRGFLFMYTPGYDSMMFLASNVFEMDGGARAIARALAELVMTDG